MRRDLPPTSISAGDPLCTRTILADSDGKASCTCYGYNRNRPTSGRACGGETIIAVSEQLMTAEMLLRLFDDQQRHELLAGELRTIPPPFLTVKTLCRIGPCR